MPSCIFPLPGYSHHSGAIFPSVLRWVLHSKGDGSAEKAQRGQWGYSPWTSKGIICPESLWVKQVGRKEQRK